MLPFCGCGNWEEIVVECGSLLASSFPLQERTLAGLQPETSR